MIEAGEIIGDSQTSMSGDEAPQKRRGGLVEVSFFRALPDRATYGDRFDGTFVDEV